MGKSWCANCFESSLGLPSLRHWCQSLVKASLMVLMTMSLPPNQAPCLAPAQCPRLFQVRVPRLQTLRRKRRCLLVHGPREHLRRLLAQGRAHERHLQFHLATPTISHYTTASLVKRMPPRPFEVEQMSTMLYTILLALGSQIMATQDICFIEKRRVTPNLAIVNRSFTLKKVDGDLEALVVREGRACNGQTTIIRK